jgi:hypothetical protein
MQKFLLESKKDDIAGKGKWEFPREGRDEVDKRDTL